MKWYAGYAGWDRPGNWFVADSPTADSEARIVSGLTREQAAKIADAHNADTTIPAPPEPAIDVPPPLF